MAMKVEDKLGRDKFHLDSNYAHIEINSDCKDQALINRLIMACPAKLYRLEDDGSLAFSYEGCLECGTCRVLAGTTVLKSWNYPMGGKGVGFTRG